VKRFCPAILSTYLAVKVAVDTVVALGLLILLYSAADLVEVKSMTRMDLFSLFHSYLYRLPSTATLLLPLAAALGVSFEKAALHRSGEWDAMEALGISPVRTTFRLLLVSMCCVFLAVFLSFWLAPVSTSSFESQMRLYDKAKKLLSDGWISSEIGYIRIAGDGQIQTVIRTNSSGNAVSRWERIERNGIKSNEVAPAAVWEATSGWRTGQGFPAMPAIIPKPPARPPVNDLVGQSLTYFELERAVINAERMGISGASLRAERGLRWAIIVACFIIPSGVLGLLISFRICRAGPSILLCMVSTVVFWLLLAVAWNGTVQDMWSAGWPAVGVPVGFCILTGGVIWIRTTILRIYF
jgi:hypothetical protein